MIVGGSARIWSMNARAKEIYAEALELSDEERTQLGWELLASAQVELMAPPDEAWATEIERRIANAKAGRSQGVAADEAIATLRAEMTTMGRRGQTVDR